MATKNRVKGGTMKTSKTLKSAAKAAAKGGVKAGSKVSVKASRKKSSKPESPSKKNSSRRNIVQAHPIVEAKIELGPLSTNDYGDEPPPSLSTPPVRGLAWGYSLVTELGDDTMTNYVVEAGTKVAVEGDLERLAYVYVVQISADDRSVEVLYPPAGGARRMRPGTRIRIPAGTGWVVTTKKGRLRTIASTYPLTDEQIAALT